MNNWIGLFLLGVLSIIAGIIALYNPLPTSLSVELFTGWAFMVIGILQIIEAFSVEGWGGKIWTMLLGFLSLATGIVLLANPAAGLISLSILLGALFFSMGLFEFILGWSIKDTATKWIVVLSGLLSFILGILIFGNIGIFAAEGIGIMLGIKFLTGGSALIAISFAKKAGEFDDVPTSA